ncbi:hypothetical protein CA13_12440 [Planctomycetes bacterium CA13]|uniref:Uncharacterized protein n=1 Tax=Novipirellula herctigrandis TaxID=2527986 RepID=A0A5C5YZ01_9BACT|nr:hypothetical protein CA13_12440 [Planctomycetes bacterium CA13]
MLVAAVAINTGRGYAQVFPGKVLHEGDDCRRDQPTCRQCAVHIDEDALPVELVARRSFVVVGVAIRSI